MVYRIRWMYDGSCFGFLVLAENIKEIQNAQEASRFLSIFSNYHFSRNFRTSSSGSPENLLISSGENLESSSMRCAVSKACS